MAEELFAEIERYTVAHLIGKLTHPDTNRGLEPRSREFVGSLLASSVRDVVPLPPIGRPDELQRMQDDGFTVLPDALAPAQVADVVAYLKDRPVFNAHYQEASDQVGRALGHGAESYKFGSYAWNETFFIPHLLEFFTSRRTLELVANYLGAAPTIYSLNTWWSFPRGNPTSGYDGQTFHRDMDCLKTCTVFVYLTDVDEDSGPHTYIRKTHLMDPMDRYLREHPEVGMSLADFFTLPQDGYSLQDFYKTSLAPLFANICGPAGTGFASDPYGLHRGTHPAHKPRLAAWARFAIRALGDGILGGQIHRPLEKSEIGDRYPDDPLARYALRGFFV